MKKENLSFEQRLSKIRSVIRRVEENYPSDIEEQLTLLRNSFVEIIMLTGAQNSGNKDKKRILNGKRVSLSNL